MVELLDQRCLRAEVRGEAQASEGQVAERCGAHGVEEALDAGLAEEVDGLAGSPTRKTVCEWPSQACGEQSMSSYWPVEVSCISSTSRCCRRAPSAAARSSAPESSPRAWRASRLSSVKSHCRVRRRRVELDQRAAEDAEEGLGDGPLFGGIVCGGQGVATCSDGAAADRRDRCNSFDDSLRAARL